MEDYPRSRRQFFTHAWACDALPPPWLRYCWSRYAGSRHTDLGPLLGKNVRPPESEAVSPLISVVLPVFNGERYIEAAITSTLKASENYPLELIIVDDGSTDNTATIINFYRREPEIHCLWQANSGVAAAINRGMSVARGAFVTWTSADNIFMGGALDELANHLLMNPDVVLAYGNVQLIDASGHPHSNSAYRPMDQQPENRSILHLPVEGTTLPEWGDNFINACFLYRRRIAQLVGEYRSDLVGFEDFDYWLRLSLFGQLAHIFSDRPLYLYRLHEEALTSKLQPLALQKSVELRRKQIKQLKRDHEGVPAAELYSVKLKGQAKDRIPELSEISHSSAASTTLAITPHSGTWEFYHTSLRGLRTTPRSDLLDIELANSRAVTPPTMLSPLQIPQLLKRARSTSFHAVAQPKNTRSTWGFFCPEKDTPTRSAHDTELLIDALAQSARLLSQVCFVLVATNSGERAFADEVNRRCHAENLRIIQLEECDEPFNNEQSLLAYTYILSDLDWIFSLKLVPLSKCISEVHCELGLGAAAGIGVLFAHLKAERAEDCTIDDARPALSQIEAFSLLAEPPHLAAVCLDGVFPALSPQARERGPKGSEPLSRSDIALLRNFQYRTRPHLDQRTLEQWISTQELGRFKHILRELILARELEAS